jgi:3-hydroxybutyryl-CoA dehydrogenase
VEAGELGVKSGKGFFDYTDRPLNVVLKQRDDALIDVFASVKDLIWKHV